MFESWWAQLDARSEPQCHAFSPLIPRWLGFVREAWWDLGCSQKSKGPSKHRFVTRIFHRAQTKTGKKWKKKTANYIPWITFISIYLSIFITSSSLFAVGTGHGFFSGARHSELYRLCGWTHQWMPGFQWRLGHVPSNPGQALHQWVSLGTALDGHILTLVNGMEPWEFLWLFRIGRFIIPSETSS